MKKIKLPKIRFSALKKAFLFVLAGGVIFSAGYLLGSKNLKVSSNGFPKVTISRNLPQDRQNLDFSLFWKVWDTLETSYFDKNKLVSSQMVYGAIKGMVAAVGDPYTVFLPPDENKVVQEDLEGNFEGVGIQIGFRGTQLAVIAPLPNTPASEAGIKAGDFIIGIKDEAKKIDMGTVGISLPDAVQAIRGPAGSVVSLTLLREGMEKPIVADITRAAINVPSVIVTNVGENEEIAHVQLLKFGGETNGEWDKAVIEVLKNPKIKGVILDVRNNPGGFLQGAVDIASEFVETGSVVVIQENAQGAKEEFKSTKLGRLRNVPLVVLVNKGSASASEILAGALRDLKHTQIVGETTFGKGTIQEPREINGGAGLHITVAKWLTPSGYWVDGKGLEPDVKVEDDLETTEDEQLQAAIDLLSKQ